MPVMLGIQDPIMLHMCHMRSSGDSPNMTPHVSVNTNCEACAQVAQNGSSQRGCQFTLYRDEQVSCGRS